MHCANICWWIATSAAFRAVKWFVIVVGVLFTTWLLWNTILPIFMFNL